MYRLLLFFILLVQLTACHNDFSKNTPAYKYIPNNADVVFKTLELNRFISDYTNHPILSNFKAKGLTSQIKALEAFTPNNASYIAFYDSDESKPYYVFITKYSEHLILKDSTQTLNFKPNEKPTLKTLTFNNSRIYCKLVGAVFIASNSKAAINNLNKDPSNQQTQRLIKTAEDNMGLTMFFNPKNSGYKKLLFNIAPKNNIAMLDLDLTAHNIKFNGLLTSEDSIIDVMDSFRHTIPQKTTVANIAPNHSTSIFSFSYDDFSVLETNLNRVNQKKDSSQTFLNYTNEIALIEFNNSKILSAHTLDSDLLLGNLDVDHLVETFKTIDIYAFKDPHFFRSKLKPLIDFDNALYFAVYDNYVLFSDSIEALKSIISSILNKQTLAHYKAYKALMHDLNSEASIFSYKNNSALSALFEKPIEKYYANVVQFIKEDDYTYVNGIIQKFKKPRQANSVSEDFTLKLDSEILVSPQVVKNHITNTYDIVVQDVNNMLYLISNSGKTLWKKQLQGEILGQIEQVDTYKNGKLQLAFATSNRLYLMDRNGNDVGAFPLKFSDKITQPLSVFDYDSNKNYRLLITQGVNLLMYNIQGNMVKGFDYKSDTKINCQPKHFRLSKKDYIVFSAGHKLKILNRRGKTRVDVSKTIKFSANEIYLHKNRFTSTNTLGQMIQVSTQGKLTAKDLGLPKQHTITATSKTFVSMYENRLNIRSNTLHLDFGNYTNPQIFYRNDKIYVSTTDLQSKKVYLFDSQGKSIPNFPIYGTSKAILKNIDKDSNLELVVLSDEKTITTYKIN